jgi:hypothetical protein
MCSDPPAVRLETLWAKQHDAVGSIEGIGAHPASLINELEKLWVKLREPQPRPPRVPLPSMVSTCRRIFGSNEM